MKKSKNRRLLHFPTKLILNNKKIKYLNLFNLTAFIVTDSKINLIISEYPKNEIYSDKIYFRYPVELLLLPIFISSKIK